MRVRNDGDEQVTVELYVGSASIAGGHLTFADRQGDDGDLVHWASLSPSRVTVAPRGTADTTVRFAVPAGVDAGERLGVIWAQPPATGGATSVVNRVGVRVYLSVGDGAAPVSDFRIDALTAARDASGAPVLEATVTNVGGRAIEPLGTATVASTDVPFAPGTAIGADGEGHVAARVAAEIGTDPVPVRVVLSANGVERRADATVTFPAAAGRSATPVRIPHDDGDTSVARPAIVAALLAAVALAGTVRAARSRPRGR